MLLVALAWLAYAPDCRAECGPEHAALSYQSLFGAAESKPGSDSGSLAALILPKLLQRAPCDSGSGLLVAPTGLRVLAVAPADPRLDNNVFEQPWFELDVSLIPSLGHSPPERPPRTS